jgi:hypothetical protein
VQVDLIQLTANVVVNSVYLDSRFYDEQIQHSLVAIKDESIESETSQTKRARQAAVEALATIFAV